MKFKVIRKIVMVKTITSVVDARNRDEARTKEAHCDVVSEETTIRPKKFYEPEVKVENF